MAEASYTPAVPRERKRADPQAAVNRVIAQTPEATVAAAADAVDNGPKVLAIIPRDFILTDDGRIEHRYAKGTNLMPRAHFDHPYSKANGVTAAPQ